MNAVFGHNSRVIMFLTKSQLLAGPRVNSIICNNKHSGNQEGGSVDKTVRYESHLSMRYNIIHNLLTHNHLSLNDSPKDEWIRSRSAASRFGSTWLLILTL